MAENATILVCDDDPRVRLGMVRMLRKAGYEVLEAQGGEEGLGIAHQYRPAVVLVDWMMPDMQGPEVCRRIKAAPDLTSTIVVLVSGVRTSEEDRAEGFETGVDGYLTHPLHPRAFLAYVSALIRMRQAEQRLRQGQRQAALGTLARGMAHEINNPLMGVINYAQLLLDRLGDVDPDVAECLNGIMSESTRIANIVRGLMGISGQSAGSRGDLDPKSLVEQVLLLIASSMEEEDIHLQLDVPESLPVIHCPEHLVQQILLALLTNARESFSTQAEKKEAIPTISIKAAYFSRESTSDPSRPLERIQISVEDNGPGIEEDVREHIFEPFFTTKDRTLHTGLDLAVARDIASEFGGELSVESGPGPWTCFHLVLPSERLTSHDENGCASVTAS